MQTISLVSAGRWSLQSLRFLCLLLKIPDLTLEILIPLDDLRQLLLEHLALSRKEHAQVQILFTLLLQLLFLLS